MKKVVSLMICAVLLIFAIPTKSNADGEIAVWKTSDGTLVNKWPNSQNSYSIVKVFYSQDDQIIYAADSYTISAWDINSGDALYSLELNNPINDMIANADNSRLYVATEEDVLVLDAATGTYLKTIMTDSAVRNLAYSANNDILYVANQDNQKQMYLYDVNKAYEAIPLKDTALTTANPLSYYEDLHFSSNNKFVAIAMSNYWNSFEIFDTRTHEKIASADLEQIQSVAISHNNQRILAGKTLLNASVLPDRELEGVEVVPSSILVLPGTDQTLSFHSLFNDGTKETLATNQVTVTSSNNAVARFQYGKLFAQAEGTATITVKHANFTTSFDLVVANILELPAETNVASDKVWTMTLSGNISLNTLREKNIYVEDANGDIFPMLYYVEQPNLKRVQLIPAKNYTSGETYTIWVKDIKSVGGQALNQYTKKQFTI